MKTSKITLSDLCSIAVFTAVIAIMSQLSVPMPMGVPMTMQTFAITLSAVVLGAKKSAVAAFIYLLLGAVGVPVFAGFSGGLQALVDPSGGFLISFPLMAYLIGYGVEHRQIKGMFTLFIIIGTLANYAFGVLMFCLITQSGVMAALTACVIPFIPTAVIKAVLAAGLGLQIRSKLGVMQWN